MLSIGVIVLANVYISTIKNTNTTGWETSETALWGVLTIGGIVGLLVGVLQLFGIM